MTVTIALSYLFVFVNGMGFCAALLIFLERRIKPTEGHHYAARESQQLIQHNPKPKQQQLPLGAAGESNE